MTTKAAQPKRATGSGRGSDVRREAILDAATKLFSVHGFAETGIDEIGEAVGITGPAVYRYFASKQDLLGAVLDRAASQVSALPARVRAEATSPDDAVRRLVEYLVALTHRGPRARPRSTGTRPATCRPVRGGESSARNARRSTTTPSSSASFVPS